MNCTHSLVTGKQAEELIDVADSEKSGGIQVGQNLHQEVRRQPAEKGNQTSQQGGDGIAPRPA